jgi:hypothetical protein
MMPEILNHGGGSCQKIANRGGVTQLFSVDSQIPSLPFPINKERYLVCCPQGDYGLLSIWFSASFSLVSIGGPVI